MRISDWSSDVCSSDLWVGGAAAHHPGADDVSDPPRLLLAVLPRTRQRRDLVELSAFLARLAGDGMGGVSARQLAPDDGPAGGRHLNRPFSASPPLSTNPPSPSPRSAERRVGQECFSTCRSRGSPPH